MVVVVVVGGGGGGSVDGAVGSVELRVASSDGTLAVAVDGCSSVVDPSTREAEVVLDISDIHCQASPNCCWWRMYKFDNP